MQDRSDTAQDADLRQTGRERAVVFLLNMLVTIQVVYFYIIRVPSYLILDAYEHGQERMPFQGRMLMQYPLLWAHHSAALARAADWLTATRMWLPHHVLPEDIVEFGIDVAAVAFAGVVAKGLYQRHSARARLSNYVYPLFLIMVAATYCLVSMNFYRYLYDLPSLGFFAAGLYFLYLRESTLLFAIAFLLGTVNRETTVFLLVLFLQHRCCHGDRLQWPRLFTFRTGGVAAVLMLFWVCFQLWLTRHFGVPPANIKPGILSNISAFLWPYAWPQLAEAGAYTLPLLLLLPRSKGPEMQRAFAWMWVLPLWGVLIMVYGNAIEIRLFGEFLPLMACTAVVVAEEQLFGPDAHPSLDERALGDAEETFSVSSGRPARSTAHSAG